uniref:Uncharacterized protein n=1 Tax=Arundo donax TaxID=35708 RepID=A0A0A9GJ83_ARUDO
MPSSAAAAAWPSSWFPAAVTAISPMLPLLRSLCPALARFLPWPDTVVRGRRRI